MHATLNMGRGEPERATFHASFPESDVPNVATFPTIERCTYGERSGTNWMTIAMIVAAHVLLLVMLVKLDVIAMPKAKRGPLMVDLLVDPPAPPAQPKEQPKPVEKVKALVVVPPPIVQTQVLAPPTVTVTQTPPPPKAVAVTAPPAPAGPVSVEDVSTNMIDYVAPKYPIESRRLREEGTVRLLLIIGTDGRIKSANVMEGSGFTRLDKAAVDAARKWRFQPFMRGGQAIEVQGPVRFPFKLK